MSLPFTTLRIKSGLTIDATTTNTVLILTLENAQRFIPVFLHLEVVAITGTVITSPSIKIGTTSGGNDVMPATTPSLTLTSGVNKVSQTSLFSAGSLAPGASLYMTISTAAIGPSLLTLRPDIMGYYI